VLCVCVYCEIMHAGHPQYARNIPTIYPHTHTHTHAHSRTHTHTHTHTHTRTRAHAHNIVIICAHRRQGYRYPPPFINAHNHSSYIHPHTFLPASLVSTYNTQYITRACHDRHPTSKSISLTHTHSLSLSLAPAHTHMRMHTTRTLPTSLFLACAHAFSATNQLTQARDFGGFTLLFCGKPYVCGSSVCM